MTTYYVRSTGGSDANDGLTFATGWATIPFAISNTLGGDCVHLCADNANPFALTASITNWPFNRQWLGADLVAGTLYDGTARAPIQAVVPLAAMNQCSFHSNMMWRDIDFDANSQASIAFEFPSWTSTMRDAAFVNCGFHGATADGFVTNCTAPAAFRIHPLILYDCDIYDNARYGFYNVFQGSLIFNNCTLHHNQSYNYYGTNNSDIFLSFHACRIFRSQTNSGLNIIGDVPVAMTNSVVFDNFSHGLEFTTDELRLDIRNSIFKDNGGYGIQVASGFDSGWQYDDYNCYHNNTSGPVGPLVDGGTLNGTHNIFTDPLFVSTTDNMEDFTLQAGSPCLDTGIGFAGGQ